MWYNSQDELKLFFERVGINLTFSFKNSIIFYNYEVFSLSKVVGVVIERISPIVEELGYELVDVEYKREGHNWFLRVFIDAEQGITLDDCQTVSRKLDKLLDEWDIIPFAYFLEVSSPGLERPIKKQSDYTRFKGRNVKVKTREAIDGRKNFSGEIVGIDNDIIILNMDEGVANIPFDQITSAKLVF